jgi:hypothetical protein
VRVRPDVVTALLAGGSLELEGGRVLAIEAEAVARALGAAAVHSVSELPSSAEALDPFDAALVAELGGVAPSSVARAVSSRVRPGGLVAFVVPTPRSGLKGAASSLLGLWRRRPPVLLEELCEALLIAGLEEVSARELDDAAGTSVVWARVRWGGPQYST